jgi:hypothetical protein
MKKQLLIILLLVYTQSISAKTLEPRLYANTPIDTNVILIGYDHTQGAIPQNQDMGLENPNLKIDNAILVYGRSFGFWDYNAKFDIILPYSTLSGTAQYYGMDVGRNITGIGDIKARLTFNLLGAPALTLNEFSSYQQDTIIGLSIQATLPTGQYDKSKLLNIGTNRWALKPAIGISKQISDFTFEAGAEAEFYSTNDDFYGGIKRKQDPIYSTQAHALYSFQKGIWLALGVTYYWGGEYINDGIGTGDELENTRMGMTFTMPIDKQNAIKIYGSRGINVRNGTDFDAITVTWQYIWDD